MTENEQLSFVVLRMADLVKKFGSEKAMKIIDCLVAIHEATKGFSDDIKEDSIKWVLGFSDKSTPVSMPTDSTTGKPINKP